MHNDPVIHALRLIKAHSMRDAIKIAKGSLWILQGTPKDGTSAYSPKEIRALKIFWQNVVAYLENRLGTKLELSDNVLNTFHYRGQGR